MTLSIGQAAPDFTLKNQFGESVSLSSFKGKKNAIVTFYPWAFTGTCTGELCALRDDLSSFQNDSAELLAISCDAMFSLKIFSEKENYNFSLLSDFWPHGATAKAYGVFDESHGAAVRGTFIIDKEGIVRWQVVNGLGDARNEADYKSALAAL